ncbi:MULTISPECIES: GNAT family N-acetyltransferase [unclassified Rhodococcus (in: high G+C Gram-positive bacteria)]|uniref:GNAT family N-acetyltransferase n=1 Tax=unclassified Rhodococcus (in: high G+C Gram-positive bacteria) TaxID=192944 RepID=UPI00146BDF5E|nr:N-acetyltransferase [Rhodococcus sp. BL-253-APC-6A1W]
MIIRRELPSDSGAVYEVHRRAFAAVTPPGLVPVEPGLVDTLRAGPHWLPPFSLVCEHATNGIVGHVCATRGDVGGYPALALGPIGVLPDMARFGIGSALMHAVLGAADALDESIVVLLGHLDYYPRFGFVPAADLGITPDVPEWASHLQARPLTGYRPEMTGEFRYPSAFYELGGAGS